MCEVTALTVYFIQVKNNFVHLHSKILKKFNILQNKIGCVEIKLNDTRKYGSCYSTPFNFNGENALNISSTYAESLGIKEFDTVVVSNAAYIKSLKTVYVTPISKDDWDIIEFSAEIIQSSLLNQIRVIYAHQILSVWISKSFFIKIHVDNLDAGLSYGKLEQYTDVIISTDIKICENCEQCIMKYENQNKIDISIRNTWNFFKDIFSFSDKDEINEKFEETINCLELHSVGIFRCVPYNNSVFNFAPKLFNYPYNVFVGRNFLKHVLRAEYNDPYILCRLTRVPFVSSKESNNTNSEATEETFTSSNNLSQEIYVHLYIIDDIDVLDNATYSLVNSYPSVFVSKAVEFFFNLKLNSKVKLDFIQDRKSKEKLTEINFTILKSNSNLVEDEVRNELKNYFCSYIKLYKKLIVNNCSIFTLDNLATDVFYFTFNPVNMSFTELCLEDLNYCNFRFVKREININLDVIDEKKFKSNLIQLSFFQEIIQKLKMSLLLKLKILRTDIESKVENSNHIVIEGDVGTGKTTIIDLLHDELSKSSFGIFIKKLECKTLKGKLVPKLKQIFEVAFIECLCYQPSVLCLDDLDVLFTSSKQNNQQQPNSTISSYSSRLSNMISDLIYSYSKHHVTILATALNVSNFESGLFKARGAAPFSNSLRIPMLDLEMRQESFIQFLGSKSGIVIPDFVSKKKYLQQVSERTEGYCIQDMSDLVDQIYFQILKRQKALKGAFDVLEVQEKDIDESLASVIPLSLKGIDFHKNSCIKWNDVGGLEIAKQRLMEVLIWPSKYRKIFEQCPLKMQSGVLLYGVPGSGKTLLASAVAGESGLNFISIKGPELLSKFVGESEEGIRNTFKKAQNAKPCILFFDEFDSLAPRRGNDITGVTDRVVNQLLTELDGVESISGVWVLAATSRPDLIDPALLRPGRLGILIHCPLPTQMERLSILAVISSSMQFANDVNFESLAKITDGYTGADLKAVLYTAYADNNKIKCSPIVSSSSEVQKQTEQLDHSAQNLNEINMECLINAVQKTKPSLKPNERLNYEQLYERFLKKEGNISVKLEQQRLTYA